MKIKTFVASFAFLSFILAGCANVVHDNSYAVGVNTLAVPEALNYKNYYLVYIGPSSSSLEFNVYAGQLEAALRTKGLIRVASESRADAIIIMSYEVGAPNQESYTQIIPQFGQTGYSSAQTTGTYQGYGSYSANTYYTPRYGVTGYMPVNRSITTYRLSINLNAAAKDGFGTKRVKQLWQATFSALSLQPDLRPAFPYMLEAGVPFIGSDSGGNITMKVPKHLNAQIPSGQLRMQ